MQNQKELLWPYSKKAAILAIPFIWIIFAIVFSLTQQYADWPGAESQKLVIIFVIVLSFIPIALVLLDYFQRHGAAVDVKGLFKIDFSSIDMSRPDVRRDSPGIPDNIGVSGPIVSDTAPMNIIETLKEATNSEIVVIDLKAGEAWWVTRLIALSAGAVRAGSPNAFVFVGKRGNVAHTFLGWGEPKEILQALLTDKKEYQERYQKSMGIAKQVIMYDFNKLTPPGMTLHNDVVRYINDLNFANLGEEVSEQILMDQLAVPFGYETGSLEDVPDRLTYSRLNDLFGHCLYHDAVNLNRPNEEQISTLLDSQAPYLALVRNGKYESMLKREDGERLIMSELFLQAQQKTK